MKRLTLIAPIVFSLSLISPVSADDHRRGGREDRGDRGRSGGQRFESHRPPARPSFGFGIRVAPRPIVVAPAYPVYGGGGGYANDPYYSSSAYPSSGYPSWGYPQSGPSSYQDDPYYPQDQYPQDAGYGSNGTYSAYAPFAPPPLQREYCPPMPGAGMVWVNGFWRWGGSRYAWSSGVWMRPPYERASFIAGGWHRAGGNYGWRRGYWRR